MNLFSYESKPMQILMQLGDLIILNLLYLLCCIPIFTIGAAQAGLYSGVKTMQDPDDDTYVTAAFFKGFRTGFSQVTIAWCLLLVVEIVLAAAAYVCTFYQQAINAQLPLYAAIIGFCIVAIFQSLVTVFHCRFSCTAWQLLRNVWYLLVAHPIRSIGVALLTWFPLFFFAASSIGIFMTLTPIWACIYFSGAFSFNYTFMKKPFQTLIDQFNETQQEQSESAEENTEE